MVKVRDIVTCFEEFAPSQLAEPGDPIGLQIGNLDQEVHKMMVTLDVRPEVVAEAIAKDVDFIFAHHPVLFRPIKHFDLAVPQNKMYAQIIQNGITVYGAHTNLDSAQNGMNDWLATALGLQQVEVLEPNQQIGNLVYGLGRIGNLNHVMTVQQFADKCKQVFNLQGLRVIANDLGKKIKRVAILGGSGGKFYPAALNSKADAYVTGDISYHTAHDMLAANLNVFDVGHYVESICKPHLAQLFKDYKTKNNWDFEIYISKVNTDPFTFL
ncbi:Nif3-like dinuclear metal center hexameric protein [Ligilactobacillus sp. WILCCON 0076]|uniref:GTP cyclohydrolase 1 type 2 homolog n=1 Tax=Ligilactobacillus ubinensis TaxID=2876789 RepID=A0A9X2FIS4_9LACO|nr:Nif3-like dinuclear metal center hexameric protein [Ligilactobacillus ubinensis]MCP0886179.1 Nif3-like dinuclear metal center hexameric protein [Ligilactobacillus ubinensis]